MHRQKADEAYIIGRRGQYTPVGAYLAGDEIIKIALQHDVNMIHPGYGFLSENAEFAKKVEKAGMIVSLLFHMLFFSGGVFFAILRDLCCEACSNYFPQSQDLQYGVALAGWLRLGPSNRWPRSYFFFLSSTTAQLSSLTCLPLPSSLLVPPPQLSKLWATKCPREPLPSNARFP